MPQVLSKIPIPRRRALKSVEGSICGVSFDAKSCFSTNEKPFSDRVIHRLEGPTYARFSCHNVNEILKITPNMAHESNVLNVSTPGPPSVSGYCELWRLIKEPELSPHSRIKPAEQRLCPTSPLNNTHTPIGERQSRCHPASKHTMRLSTTYR